MTLRDLHTHTVFSDGKNTPEEMAAAALELGMTELGFSDHSYTFFDESYCIPREKIQSYRDTVCALKEAYHGRLSILCGIEQDFYSAESTAGFDYVIGSVHYILADGVYIPVDETPQILLDAAQANFGGDIYALIEAYFATVRQVVARTNADIIGHIDLIRKFNRGGQLFDETHPRYRDAAFSCADALLKTGRPFEINTGAISRGYQDTPYPSAELLRYIRTHGGRTILSSDSHSRDTLCFEFDKYL